MNQSIAVTYSKTVVGKVNLLRPLYQDNYSAIFSNILTVCQSYEQSAHF